MKDLSSNINIISAIAPVAVGTTGTGQTSAAVDLKGYESAAVEASYGAVTATDAVFTVALTEADTTGGSFTAVADADMVGDEDGAGLAAAVRVDGTTEKVTKRVGYIGAKRYIKVNISSTVTAGTPIGANVIRGNPRRHPATA